VRLIAEITGKPLEIEKDDERLRPSQSEVERLLCDPSKAQAILGWRSQLQGHEGLREGLTRCLEWFSTPANRAHYRDIGRYVI
jgi:nucleoside-diphosphate-sugar epimerase